MKQNNFYPRWQEDAKADKVAKRRAMLWHVLPVAAMVTAFLAVFGVLAGISINRRLQAAQILAWCNREDVQTDYMASLEAQAQARLYQSRTLAVQNLFGSKATYPAAGSEVLARIQAAGPDSVTVVFTSYDSSTGLLGFDAKSPQVIDIPTYVVAMEKTGLFSKVSYVGYALEDDTYTINMSCVMAAAEEGDE